MIKRPGAETDPPLRKSETSMPVLTPSIQGNEDQGLFKIQVVDSSRSLRREDRPMDHLDSYKSLMSLQGYSDEIMCKAFSTTLQELARSWFRKLSPGTIDSFDDLSRLFVANFMSCRAILEVEDPSDKVVVMAMMEGLRPGPLFDSLSKNVPKTLLALQSKAGKYIAAEELVEAKRRRRGRDDKRKEPETRRTDYRDEARNKRPDRDSRQRTNDKSPHTPPRRPELVMPPLNAPIAQVLTGIKHEEFVKWLGKIKPRSSEEKQKQLKEQIADLIKKGYLRKYIADRSPPGSPERRYDDNRQTAGDIQVIHGGFGSRGCSSSSRKRHARNASRRAEEEVYNLSLPFVSAHVPITFTNDDLRGLHLPHDDALVILVIIANFTVLRILVDNGSSENIFFISAFDKMKIRLDKLYPFHTPLVRFGGNTTHPLGWIKLLVTLGIEPHQTTV
ncbi:uncharacterized protein LOC130786440 [Actinidia eriantha]|uniref:uncharacterized protein LOC130786440 n=1 Tax=Actinidia eriantha TaxID=165200 RepID=UPI002588DB34|nr:uncharacterized protein LOC130786440 [Actinidia eriantha]